jgi:hypothetical protein
MWLAPEVANVLLRSVLLRSLASESWNVAFPGISSLVHPMDWQALRRKSAMNRGVSVFVEFVDGSYWSNAAWPS